MVGTTIVFLIVFGAVVPPSVAGACTWSKVPAPRPPRAHSVLIGVDGDGEDVWAVGATRKPRKAFRTLVAHRSGGWSRVSSPNRGSRSNQLSDLAYVASDDVWAVGSAKSGRTSYRDLIVHWDGTSWSRVTGPASGRRLDALGGVDGIVGVDPLDPLTPPSVWAVGASATGTGPNADLDPRILRFDETGWNEHPVAPPSQPGLLTGVEVISPTDVWAVGMFSTDQGSRPLVYHYDGLTWTQMSITGPDGQPVSGALNAVAAVGPNDVWAVGLGGAEPLIVHFDGSTWSVADAPIPAGQVSFLYGVAATPAGDVWGTGVTIGRRAAKTLIQHGGTEPWTTQPSPDPHFVNFLGGIVAPAGGVPWTVGYSAPEQGRIRPLILTCS